jgi:hypothetical protein
MNFVPSTLFSARIYGIIKKQYQKIMFKIVSFFPQSSFSLLGFFVFNLKIMV